MDTKLKKRNRCINFALFFISVSLLLANGARFAKTALFQYPVNDYGFSRLFERDYQNTREFRSYMQGRLSDFLIMAANGTNNAKQQRYHEAIRENKNLCYRIVCDGKELYSNLDGVSWDENSKTLPEGYNFRLFFNGETVSIQKDGEELDIYGDGYYRDSSQWYVPGYKNYAADTEMKKVQITMLAAKEPADYSYARYHKGGYTQIWDQLYEIAKNVRDSHDQMRRSIVGLAVGMVLFLLFSRKQKRAADAAIGQITGKIWFEGKLILLLLLAAGLHAVIGTGNSVYYGDAIRTYDLQEAEPGRLYMDYDTSSFDTSDKAQTDADTANSASETTMETSVTENDWLQEQGMDLTELGIASAESSEVFVGWAQEQNLSWTFLGLADALTANPDFLLVFFWFLYLLINDLHKNRGHFLDGIIRKIAREVRTRDLKQPFAVQQVHRFLLMASISVLTVAAVLSVMMFRKNGITNTMETVLTLCLILSVFAAVCFRCISRTKQEAADLDFLADHIRAVQGGDYTEPEYQPADTALEPLFASLSQIRQGMETAVSEQLSSERMKVELVANVSHDLKTPLTSIISYIEFLKQEEDLPEHVRDYIRILDEKAGRLHTIVQDVFAVSKAASGQLPVEPERLDFGKLLRQTLADMDEQIRASSVSLKTEIPAGSMQITADGARLYRVFQNLIQNALTYSLEGSRVFVDLKKEGDQAVASVKNISRQELRAGTDFTERFLRGDKSRTDGGAGLGLSIAKSFTEACGGTFTLLTDADLFVVRVGFRLE